MNFLTVPKIQKWPRNLTQHYESDRQGLLTDGCGFTSSTLQTESAVCVEYPHGAGGVFLSSVLACCTNNLAWQLQHQKNFHNFPHHVSSGHWLASGDHVLSIDHPGARYNFWIYYWKKRVLWELNYYRYKSKRWIRCPYHQLDAYGDAFWLLNQAKFIEQYHCRHRWQIDWVQMVNSPELAWSTMCEFLLANDQPNFWTLDHWVTAVKDYVNTLPKKIKINQNHVSWQIWAVATLQNKKIVPEFDLIEYFGQSKYKQWLDNHAEKLMDFTQATTVEISR